VNVALEKAGSSLTDGLLDTALTFFSSLHFSRRWLRSRQHHRGVMTTTHTCPSISTCWSSWIAIRVSQLLWISARFLPRSASLRLCSNALSSPLRFCSSFFLSLAIKLLFLLELNYSTAASSCFIGMFALLAVEEEASRSHRFWTRMLWSSDHGPQRRAIDH